MMQKQKRLVALVLGGVLGGVLGMASATWAGARIVTTPAGCTSNFKNSTLYNTCMTCVKAHGQFKLGKNNSWGCK